MEEVVNELILGDTDPNDCVRFAILSSNFDGALNTKYHPEKPHCSLGESIACMIETGWQREQGQCGVTLGQSSGIPITTQLYTYYLMFNTPPYCLVRTL